MMDMYAGLPGPIDRSVLHRQDKHRSDRIWTSQDQSVLTQTLTTRRSDSGLWGHVVHPRVMRHLYATGFYGLSRIGFIRLDPALITALVERWRPETHTFHLPIGEVTITLQDVAVLWGLPIDGSPVTGSETHRVTHDWQRICQNLLGRTPPDIDISGGTLRIGWITEHFIALPDGAPDELVVQFARARMLHLIGGIMLPDKLQNRVQLMFLPLLEHLDQIHTYSWGSACLARLYCDLCRASSPEAKDIGGASVLLQLWAWERLPRLAPHLPPGVVASGLQPIVIDENSLPPGPHGCRWGVEHRLKNTPKRMVVAFRDQLDQLRADEFIWQPYSDDLIGRLPVYCRQGMELWRAKLPLICFDVIEWHFPDRVLRQFGFRQSIPGHCDTEEQLHTVDRQGKPEIHWPEFHAQYLQMWADRVVHVIGGELTGERMSHDDPYMVWYRRHSRILIGNPRHWIAPEDGYHGSGSSMVLMTRYMTAIHDIAYQYLDMPTEDLLDAFHRDMQRIRHLSLQILETIDKVD